MKTGRFKYKNLILGAFAVTAVVGLIIGLDHLLTGKYRNQPFNELTQAASGIGMVTSRTCAFEMKKRSPEEVKELAGQVYESLSNSDVALKMSLSAAIEFKNYQKAQELIRKYHCR